MTKEPRPTPIASERSFVPFIRKARLVNIDTPTTRTPTIVGERMDMLLFKVLIKSWVTVIGKRGKVMEAHIPAATIVGIIAGKHVESGRHRSGENIASSCGE